MGIGSTATAGSAVLVLVAAAAATPAGAGPAAGPAGRRHVPPTFDPAARERDQGAGEMILSPGGDLGFTGIVNTGWTPPDPHMAVGPEHLVLMTNGEITFYTKQGVRTFRDEIENSFGFWGELDASGFVFDPEVIYDPLSGRFFAMAADRDGRNNHSYALIAVSDDSDPNGTWFKYRFDTTALAGPTLDSPNLAVDDEALYVTGDGFGGPRPYPVFTYDKASLLVGAPPAAQRSTFLSTSTQSAGIPPVSFDHPPALYMIEHREGGSNTSVRLIALRDPLGTPSFTTTSLTVPLYGPPEDPPQAGTNSRPETFDARFWSVAYRNGSLWAVHHVNASRVVARWYEFAMNGWPVSGDVPALVQSGTIDPGATIRTFFPSITVDAFGNAAVTYARSSPSEFISMATAFRFKSDPAGTFRPGVIRKVTVGPYTRGRWGDYSAVDVNPRTGRGFWAHHEYAQNNSWRTWVQSFTPVFATADVNFDGAVDFGDLLAVLGAWGPCGDCPEDIDGDGMVGFSDLLMVLAQWS